MITEFRKKEEAIFILISVMDELCFCDQILYVIKMELRSFVYFVSLG